MKKLLYAVNILTALFFLMSCDNFRDSSLFQQGLEEKLDYANSTYHLIFVNAEEGSGSFIQGGGTQNLKKTDSFDVEFNVNSAYKFLNWIAVDRNNSELSRDNYIKFSDYQSTKTSVTLLDDCDDILIRPYTLPYLTVSEFSPEYRESGVGYNSSIKIKFSSYITESAFSFTDDEINSLGLSEDNLLKAQALDGTEYVYGYEKNNKTYFKNIEITSSSISGAITGYFEAPVIINGDTLLLTLKESDYSLLLADIPESGTIEITVTLSSDICDTNGISFSDNYSELSYSYLINSEIIADTASTEVLFEADSGSGTLSLSGLTTVYTELTYPLTFIPSDQYCFQQWGIFYASSGTEILNGDKILTISDKKSKETSFVLNTAVPGIMVKPVCAKRPSVLLMSPTTDGTEAHTSITVTFSTAMKLDDLRWSYSDIKDNPIQSVLRDDDNKIYGYISNSNNHIWRNIEIVSSSGDNLLSYFKCPKLDLDNTRLVIEAKTAGEGLTIPSGTLVFVRISKTLCDLNGISLGDDGDYIEFSYLVGE